MVFPQPVAHEGDALARTHAEVDVAQDRARRVVAKDDVVQLDLAARLVERERARDVRCLGGDVEQGEQAPGAGDGVLQLGRHAGDVVEGLGVLVGVAQEGGEPAHGDAAPHGDERAEDAYGRVDEGVRKARGGVHQGREEHRLEALPSERGVRLGKALVGTPRHVEGLDLGDAADHLLDVCGELAAQPRLPREVPGAVCGDEARGEHRDGRQQRHHGGYGRVERKHEGERHDDREHPDGQLLEGHEQPAGEHVGVGHDARGEVAVAVGAHAESGSPGGGRRRARAARAPRRRRGGW